MTPKELFCSLVMIEGEMEELPESDIIDALRDSVGPMTFDHLQLKIVAKIAHQPRMQLALCLWLLEIEGQPLAA